MPAYFLLKAFYNKRLSVPRELETTCCIAGGGPAGMMLAFLLARGGIDVILLEKHADFFRDFRGDTIHASTFQSMDELGLLKQFLEVPHDEQKKVMIQLGNKIYTVANFEHLHVPHPVLGFMPQWDFLNFIKQQAQAYEHFHLMLNTEAKELIKQNGTITGILAQARDGPLMIHARLSVACDGRHSVLREQAGLAIEELGAPIDVLWFRISRQADDQPQSLLHAVAGKILVTAVRENYYQCGYIIPKATLSELQNKGLNFFRDEVAAILPFNHDRLNEIKSWDDVKLLSVIVNRLKKWYLPGLLFIGDAAHAMSPAGGVGINLAIQDAVATANILYDPLLKGSIISEDWLEKVQHRRESPTRKTQWLQVQLQNKIIYRSISSSTQPFSPFILNVINRLPYLQRWPAKFFGLGFQPEHIRTLDVHAKNS